MVRYLVGIGEDEERNVVAVRAALAHAVAGRDSVLLARVVPPVQIDPVAEILESNVVEEEQMLLEIEAKKKMEILDRECRRARVDSSFVVYVDDHPGASLCKAAKDHNIDCIVVGRRELGKLKRLLTSSTSKYCSDNAECNVLVAKRLPQESPPHADHVHAKEEAKAKEVKAEEHRGEEQRNEERGQEEMGEEKQKQEAQGQEEQRKEAEDVRLRQIPPNRILSLRAPEMTIKREAKEEGKEDGKKGREDENEDEGKEGRERRQMASEGLRQIDTNRVLTLRDPAEIQKAFTQSQQQKEATKEERELENDKDKTKRLEEDERERRMREDQDMRKQREQESKADLARVKALEEIERERRMHLHPSARAK